MGKAMEKEPLEGDMLNTWCIERWLPPLFPDEAGASGMALARPAWRGSPVCEKDREARKAEGAGLEWEDDVSKTPREDFAAMLVVSVTICPDRPNDIEI